MTYVDMTIVCRECGDEFVFSSSEQEFFARKNLTHHPGRCASCRAILKGQRAANAMQPAARPVRMLTPDGTVQPQRGRQLPQREVRPLYDATCARCGGPAKVPFLPRGRRPIYCAACFTHTQAKH